MLKGAGDFRALIMAAAMIGHVPPVSAQPDPDARARFVAGARAMMAELGGESRDDARRIAAAYGKGGTLRMFRDRDDLRAVTRQGVVAPFPVANNWFNVRPRLSGWAPIGEKDLAHQELYVGARPATLALLMRIGSRVRTPLDVTSMVRHGAYQQALARTNANARTDVPTHALGVAFDLSILNIRPAAARELRDVLRAMRAEGDLFFVAEVRQLVFHVVQAPGREAFYAEVFEGLRHVPPPAWVTAPVYSRPPRRAAAPDVLHESRAERALTVMQAVGIDGISHVAVWSAALMGFGRFRRWRRTARVLPHECGV